MAATAYPSAVPARADALSPETQAALAELRAIATSGNAE
jgi:hypothetical protein